MKAFAKTFRLLALSLALSIALFGATDILAADQDTKAKEGERKPEVAVAGTRQGVLSANEYVSLHFTLPLMDEGRFRRRQFIIVVALKLTYADARDPVLARIPKIRDALYPELYRLISFRREGRRVIDKERLKEKLSPIALAHVSDDLVSEIMVYKAYIKPAP